jgi:hypothetical protein
VSVSPSNYARPFYESEGFHKVGESGTSWTLLLQLDRALDCSARPGSRIGTMKEPDPRAVVLVRWAQARRMHP